MSAVGTLGLIHMWNFGECWTAVQEYYNTVSGYAKAGAFIALGMSASGVWNENDPLMALIEEGLKCQEIITKLGAAIGLGIAYAGSSKNELRQLLEPIINDQNLPMETCVCAALSAALVHISDCDEDVSNSILTSLMEFTEENLNKPIAKLFGVAIGLNFLG